MGFSPYYKALFTQPFILQMVAIIQADMQSALNLVTGVTFNPATPTLGLQSYIEYDLAVMPPGNVPQLIVTPPRVLKIDEGSQLTERSGGMLEFITTVGNQSPNVLAQNLQMYLRALAYVIDTAESNAASDQSQMYQSLPISLPFWTPTTTTPIQTGSLIYMRVVSMEFGNLYRNQQGFLQAASLLARIDLEEV
jgi:hypothetical protein